MAHLLSAHPDVLIADEVNALHYVQQGYSVSRVYSLIRWKDGFYERQQRKKGDYDYAVPGTAQGEGHKKHPLVIGDAKGGASTRIIASDPTIIERLRTEVGVPIRAIVHVRHPFDIMATKNRRHPRRSLNGAMRGMERLSDRMERAFDLLQDDERLVQTLEELIADPKGQLERLFRFVDVEPRPDIIDACAAKIWKAPKKTRSALQLASDDEARLTSALKDTRLFGSYFKDV